MSMSTRDRAALNPDTLIVIHLLNEFFGALGDEENPNPNIFPRELLNELLWGAASFGNFRRDWPFRYLPAKNPPIEDLMELFWSKGLNDTECTFLLPKARVEQLVKEHQIDALCKPPMDYDEDYANVWKQIVTESEHPPHAVFSTLGKSRLLWRGLIHARVKDFWTPFQTLHPGEPFNIADEETVQKILQYRPFELNFFNNWKEIHAILRKVEDDYLEDFKAGRVVFVTNHMKWQKKLDYLMPIIKRMHEEHGPFWISLAHLYDGSEVSREFRPVELQLPETLFALQKMGELVVSACKQDEHQDVEFRVHLQEREVPTIVSTAQSDIQWLLGGVGEDGKPMNPDLLLAIHLISHFLEGIEGRIEQDSLVIGYESRAALEMENFQRNILDDLLWGVISYESPSVETPFNEDPDSLIFFQLISLLLEAEEVFKNVKFHIQLSEEEQTAYQKYSGSKDFVDQIVGSGPLTEKQLWEAVISGQRYTLSLGEPNAYRFLHILLLARQEAIERAQNEVEYREFYQKADRRRRLFRPFSIDLLSEPTKLREFLSQKKIRYLYEFTQDRIDWAVNQPKWDRQVEYFVPIFKELDHLHGAFWISTGELEMMKDSRFDSGYHLLETLLALDTFGHFTTFAVRRRGVGGVEFKVLLKILKEQTPSLSPQIDALNLASIQNKPTVQSTASDAAATDTDEAIQSTEAVSIDMPNGDCTELDSHISLSDLEDKMGLYLKHSGVWKFHRQRPQIIKIIRHFYDIRTAPDSTRMVKQLADIFSKSGSSSPISRGLTALHKFCKAEGCKQILVPTSDSKWTLNPKLDCCENLRED